MKNTQINLNTFKLWVELHPELIFHTRSCNNCPVAQFASDVLGVPCWVNWDEIFFRGSDGQESRLLNESWVGEIVAIVDELPGREISGANLLKLIANL